MKTNFHLFYISILTMKCIKSHWMRIQHTSMQAGTEKILVRAGDQTFRQTCPEVNNVTNFKGENNYTVLDVEGTGHYVGCNLTVKHYQGSWWGEGNDMFFIDGEEYPSLNGTGTEDYFNHAWGMQKNAYPFFGTIVHESDTDGFQVSYRFHITDPVRFEKSLKVTIEHGHANHLSDDWSSTAYWYQTLPTAKPITILPVEERIPNVPVLQNAIFRCRN